MSWNYMQQNLHRVAVLAGRLAKGEQLLPAELKELQDRTGATQAASAEIRPVQGLSQFKTTLKVMHLSEAQATVQQQMVDQSNLNLLRLAAKNVDAIGKQTQGATEENPQVAIEVEVPVELNGDLLKDIYDRIRVLEGKQAADQQVKPETQTTTTQTQDSQTTKGGTPVQDETNGQEQGNGAIAGEGSQKPDPITSEKAIETLEAYGKRFTELQSKVKENKITTEEVKGLGGILKEGTAIAEKMEALQAVLDELLPVLESLHKGESGSGKEHDADTGDDIGDDDDSVLRQKGALPNAINLAQAIREEEELEEKSYKDRLAKRREQRQSSGKHIHLNRNE